MRAQLPKVPATPARRPPPQAGLGPGGPAVAAVWASSLPAVARTPVHASLGDLLDNGAEATAQRRASGEMYAGSRGMPAPAARPPAYGTMPAVRPASPLHQAGGVVQAMMQEEEEDPPEFAHGDVLFSSRADGAEAAARSIYFGNGRRIRLVHPSGPHISEEPMTRHTFRAKPGGGFYGKADYKALPKDAHGERDVSGIMKAAAVGDPGKLFEIGAGGRTHPSRGKPTAETGIRSQQHLDQIVQAATAADDELRPLQRSVKRAQGREDRAEEDRAKAKRRRDRAKRRRDAAPDDDKLQRRHAAASVAHDEAVEMHRRLRQIRRTRAAQFATRVDHHNAQMRAVYPGPQG